MSHEPEKLGGEAEASQAGPEAETLAFDVPAEDAGARLDAFLAARVEGVSRSTLKRAIEDGDGLVGGGAAEPPPHAEGGGRTSPPPPPRSASPKRPRSTPSTKTRRSSSSTSPPGSSYTPRPASTRA